MRERDSTVSEEMDSYTLGTTSSKLMMQDSTQNFHERQCGDATECDPRSLGDALREVFESHLQKYFMRYQIMHLERPTSSSNWKSSSLLSIFFFLVE